MENSVVTVNGVNYSFKIICGQDKMFIVEADSDFGSVTSNIINEKYLREFQILGSFLKNNGQKNLTFNDFYDLLAQTLLKAFNKEEIAKIIHLFWELVNESKFKHNMYVNEGNN